MNITTTGAATMKQPQSYDLLCSFLAQRPLSQPQVATCGLSPTEQVSESAETVTEYTETMEESLDSLPSLEGVEAAQGSVTLTEERAASVSRAETPASREGSVRGQAKRKRLRPPSHSMKMEAMVKSVLVEVKESNARIENKLTQFIDNQKTIIEKQDTFLQTYSTLQKDRNDILKRLLEQRGEPSGTD